MRSLTRRLDSLDVSFHGFSSLSKGVLLTIGWLAAFAPGCGSGDNPVGGGNGGTDAGTGTGAGGAGGATTGGAGGTDASTKTDSPTTGAGMGGAPTGAGGGTGGSARGGGDGASPLGDAAAAGFGKACQVDAECGGGLICLKATDKLIFGQGGPANGYCSVACSDNPAKCTPLGGVCVDLRNDTTDPVESYCLQTCTFGVLPATAPPKCQGRPDVGCQVVDATTLAALCRPICSQDSDCPANRKCDLGTAVCMDAASAGDPVGAHCVADPDASTTCAGLCLSVGGMASFCSMPCVLGNLQGCNWVGQGVALAGGAHGVCALSSATADVGDVGFCSQECDTVNDCLDRVDPGAFCDMTDVTIVGHGICNHGAAAGDAAAPTASDAARDARDSGSGQ